MILRSVLVRRNRVLFAGGGDVLVRRGVVHPEATGDLRHGQRKSVVSAFGQQLVYPRGQLATRGSVGRSGRSAATVPALRLCAFGPVGFHRAAVPERHPAVFLVRRGHERALSLDADPVAFRALVTQPGGGRDPCGLGRLDSVQQILWTAECWKCGHGFAARECCGLLGIPELPVCPATNGIDLLGVARLVPRWSFGSPCRAQAHAVQRGNVFLGDECAARRYHLVSFLPRRVWSCGEGSRPPRLRVGSRGGGLVPSCSARPCRYRRPWSVRCRRCGRPGGPRRHRRRCACLPG